MKKVGILTHYNVNNQGAQLQLFGLYSELKRNTNPVIVQFEKKYDHSDKDADKRNNIKLSSIPYIIHEYLIKRGLKSFLTNFVKYLKHRNFIRRKYNMVETNHPLDAIVVGSDEVFSVVEGFNEVMFGFGINTPKMLAYAPSFGQTTVDLINERQIRETITDGLSKFQLLSARDQKTQEIIQLLTGITPDVVCDPAILHDFSDDIQKCRIPHRAYLVVYSYDRNMNNAIEIESIREFARKRDLLIVSAGTFHNWCDRNIPCNCLEWLYIIKNAEYVITDTFHGCIASLITGREVAVYVRSINTNKLNALIDSTGIHNRIIRDFNVDLEQVFSERMDYQMVNLNIERIRRSSKSYFDRMISLINSDGI